ncbi:MAG: S1 RNA-binding domain-containing protein [Spirochaetota bacterium]
MAKREGNPAVNSFADYMNSTSKNRTQFQPGQMVESRIVSISNDTIFLELNGKSEGILDRAELVDKNGELTVKEGDPIKAFFLKAQNGELHFTTRISGDKVDN